MKAIARISRDLADIVQREVAALADRRGRRRVEEVGSNLTIQLDLDFALLGNKSRPSQRFQTALTLLVDCLCCQALNVAQAGGKVSWQAIDAPIYRYRRVIRYTVSIFKLCLL